MAQREEGLLRRLAKGRPEQGGGAGPFGMLGLFGAQEGYASMHERGPIIRTGMVPIVVGFDEVSAVLKDSEHFSSQFGGFGAMMAGSSGLAGGRMMLTADPPDHGRIRGVVAKAFTPRSVAALEPRVRELCREMLAPLRRREPFEVMSQLAYPLPVTVIAELLGVPPRDRDPFRRWSEDLASLDNASGISRATQTSERSIDEAVEYFRGIIDERRREPRDDLITRLVEANEGGILSNEELISNSILLLVAGYETTVQLICNCARTLAVQTEQRGRLVRDPSLVANAVEEVLRIDGVVPATIRIARNGATLGGEPLQEGAVVLNAVAAANRDPRHFDEPEAFDAGRANAAHNLGFGAGIHYCVGAPLARLEARVALEELLDAAPDWQLLDPQAATAPGFIGMRSRRIEIAAA